MRNRMWQTGALAAAMLIEGMSFSRASAQAPTSAPQAVAADVAFLQGMIAHHAQAITMGVLAPKRTKDGPINSLAERIVVSQRDEIKQMRQWLLDHGAEAPNPLARGAKAQAQHHDHALMPGMLTAAELAALERATGPAFERLFLESMIKHHEGAITMVDTLFATPGGGQDLMIYRIASDVEADQRAEIARMRALLKPRVTP